ncbi:hypothetical protein Tco_1524469 [Tanacetum coccineum]
MGFVTARVFPCQAWLIKDNPGVSNNNHFTVLPDGMRRTVFMGRLAEHFGLDCREMLGSKLDIIRIGSTDDPE